MVKRYRGRRSPGGVSANSKEDNWMQNGRLPQPSLAQAYEYAGMQNKPMPMQGDPMRMAQAAAGMMPMDAQEAWLNEASIPGGYYEQAPTSQSEEDWLREEKGGYMEKAPRPGPTRLSPGVYRGADGKIRKPRGGRY